MFKIIHEHVEMTFEDLSHFHHWCELRSQRPAIPVRKDPLGKPLVAGISKLLKTLVKSPRPGGLGIATTEPIQDVLILLRGIPGGSFSCYIGLEIAILTSEVEIERGVLIGRPSPPKGSSFAQ
jgi:hypothetical protein